MGHGRPASRSPRRFFAGLCVFVGLWILLAATARAQVHSEDCGLGFDAYRKGAQWVSITSPVLRGSFADPSLQRELAASLIQAASEQTRPALEAASRARKMAIAHRNACGEALASFAEARAILWETPREALPKLDAALAALQQLNSASGVAITRLRLGEAHWQLGRSAEAGEAYALAEPQLRSQGFPAEAVFAHYKILAIANDSLVPAAELEPLLTQLAPLHSINADLYRLLILSGLGASEARQGLFDLAMTHFGEALKVHDTCQCGPAQTFRLVDGMGLLELTLGRPEAALRDFLLAGQLLRQSGVATFSSELLFHQGRAYLDLHRLPNAAAKFRQALTALPSGSSVEYLPYLQSGLGYAYVQLGRKQEGFSLMQQAVTSATTELGQCIAGDNLGQAYLSASRLPQADQALSASLASCLHGDVRDLLAESFAMRARARLRQGNLNGALADVQQAQSSTESDRRHLVPSDAYKRAFEQRIPVYDVAVEVLAAAHRDDEALAAAEQAHGRAFLDLLATLHAEKPPEQGLQTASMDAAVTEVSPASFAHVNALTVPEMTDALTRLHSTLLSYWMTDSTLYLWVIAPGKSPVMFTTPLQPGEIGRLIRQTHDQPALGSPSQGGPSGHAWRRLYQLLVAPAEAVLSAEPDALLTIVPHGSLFRVSFAALCNSQGRYLIERYRLHTIPSVGLLHYTALNDAAAAGKAPAYLLIGNPAHFPLLPHGATLPPLPGSGVEIQAIARSMPADQVTLLEGTHAGIDELKQDVGRATMLHIATHAIVSDTDPLRSFIALDRTQSGGLLTASAVYSLSVQTHLVVLSACGTALGPITGDGVAGLNRGFFYAGAASLLATLWDLPDAPTQQILLPFYRSIQQGDSRSAALRSAQRNTLAQLRRGTLRVKTLNGTAPLPNDPFYWAAFSLSGEP